MKLERKKYMKNSYVKAVRYLNQLRKKGTHALCTLAVAIAVWHTASLSVYLHTTATPNRFLRTHCKRSLFTILVPRKYVQCVSGSGSYCRLLLKYPYCSRHYLTFLQFNPIGVKLVTIAVKYASSKLVGFCSNHPDACLLLISHRFH